MLCKAGGSRSDNARLARGQEAGREAVQRRLGDSGRDYIFAASEPSLRAETLSPLGGRGMVDDPLSRISQPEAALW